jgi:hypothetical protein
MFNKKIFYLILQLIIMYVYAIWFIFFPELMPTIVLRFLGGFLIYLSLIVIINIRKIQNDTEIKKIDEKMSEFEKRKAEFDKQISEFENQQL